MQISLEKLKMSNLLAKIDDSAVSVCSGQTSQSQFRQPAICEQTWAVQAAWHSVRLDQWGLSPSVLCYATIGKGGGGGGQVSTFYLENVNKTIVQLT